MTLVHKNPGDPGHTTDHNEIVDKVNAIPPGGAPGQVLGKDSPTDYDTSWQTVTGGGGVTSVNTRTGAVTGLAEATALTAHEADTTNIHGIADTAALVTQTDLTTHAADTTAVHGIADTSALATLAYVDAHMTDVLDAHDASAISVVPQGQQVGTDVQAAINNLDTRVAASLESGPDFLRTWALFYDDFLMSGATPIIANQQIGVLGWTPTFLNGGAIAAAAAGIADVPGFVNLQTGTTAANGTASMVFEPLALSGHGIFIMEWRCLVNALATSGGEEYAFRFGLGDVGMTVPANDGYYFEYNQSATTVRYLTAKAGVRTNTDSTFVMDTGWHRYRVVSDGGGTVTFTIDGTKAQTVPTNIPTTADFFAPAAAIIKNLGTAQRQARIDYFYLLWGVNR